MNWKDDNTNHYLCNKMSNFKASLNLSLLPQIDKEYIYLQIKDLSKVKFLLREVSNKD